MPRARKTESVPSDQRPPKAATGKTAKATSASKAKTSKASKAKTSRTTKAKTSRTTKTTRTSKSPKTSKAKPSKASTGAQAHNPHTVRPANANYPNRGPVTLTYRNPRARKPRKLTVWVHVDQVVHWIERGLWHHLSPIDPKASIEDIQVGSRFM